MEIQGRHFYLGKFDSPESHEQYRRLIARYLSQNTVLAEEAPQQSIRIDQLILQYFRFAKSYYQKGSKPTDEIVALRIVLRRLRKLYGRTEAKKFGPKAFKIVRESLIQEGLSRTYINDSLAPVRRIFEWAVAEDLIPPSVRQAVAAVSGLKRGRSAKKYGVKLTQICPSSSGQ